MRLALLAGVAALLSFVGATGAQAQIIYTTTATQRRNRLRDRSDSQRRRDPTQRHRHHAAARSMRCRGRRSGHSRRNTS